jgi:hypothetical protein
MLGKHAGRAPIRRELLDAQSRADQAESELQAVRAVADPFVSPR